MSAIAPHSFSFAVIHSFACIAVLLGLMDASPAQAADGDFVWARSMGGTSSEVGFGIAVDASGNVYTTGYFNGTVDFDPSAGTSNLTSSGGNDIFVLKLDSSGNLVWARNMGGTTHDLGNAISVDATGNVYTIGSFSGTADFDPSAGTSNLVSAGGDDIFVSKLDSSGNFVWVKVMGGTSTDVGRSIAVDSTNNIYSIGTFRGTADLDPGAGTSNMTSQGASIDTYVLKLDSSGNFAWAKAMGGSSADVGFGIAVDTSGNVYSTGYFADTVDFDPGAGTSNLTSAGAVDSFVWKLDGSGDFVWARRIGDTSNDLCYGIALDASDNVYTTGYFIGTVDFDPGAGTSNLTSAGSNDIFVSKLDSSGIFIWGRRMGGTATDIGNGIAVEAAGDVYTTGQFEGTADFDPGAGTNNLTAASSEDIFVSKLSGPDTTPPTVTVITPSTTGPTNADSVEFTVAFDEDVQDFNDIADLSIADSGTANTGATISGSGDTYTVTVTGISGDGSFTLSVNTSSDVEDAAGNGLASSVTSNAVSIDNTPPTVSIGAVTGSPVSNTRTASFPVTIGGASSIGLDSGEVSLNHIGTAGGSVNILNGTTATPTVEISGVTGDGSYTISLAAEIAEDAAGNLSAAAGPSASAVTVDNTGPTVSIGSPAGSPVNSSGTASFPVTITGSTSVSLSDFHVTLNRSGVSGGTITIVDGSTASPTVEVSGVTGNGSYTISIASGIASDALDNTSAAAGPSGGAITVDNTAPGISINAPSASITNDGPVTYTLTYTGADSISLAQGDVTLNSTSGANGTVAVSGSGLTARTVEISNITGDGTLGISISAGTAADAAGNTAGAAGPSDTFNVDNTPPSISIGTPSVSVTTAGPVTYTVTYTGASNITLADGDINVVGSGGPTGDAVVTGSGNTDRTVTIGNIAGDGTMRFFIAAGTATDAAGNSALAAPPGPSFNVDNTPPTVSVDSLVTSDNTPTLTGTAQDAASISVVVNGQVYAATLSSGTWTADVTAPLPDDFYDVVATATDAAGNWAEDTTGSELQVAAMPPDAPSVIDGPAFESETAPFQVCGTVSTNTVQLLVDGVAFPYSPGSPTWCVDLSPSDDKATTHSYDIVAVSITGVESAPTTITIDFGAPGPGVPLRWGGAALLLAIAGAFALRKARARA